MALRRCLSLIIMDLVIAQPRPGSLKVLPHHQYITPDHITTANVAQDPLDQFKSWFKEAVDGNLVKEPEAMTLSTATPSGVPSARTVLLKEVDAHGFVFFTNYTSRKSQELLSNPVAALTFYWREVHRSVRVVGSVEKVSPQESEAYFHSRPVGSQLGAWASRQSSVIQEHDLDHRLQKLKQRFASEDGQAIHVPTPDFWGGWKVIPSEIEFWSGKPSRLHDRIRYLRQPSSDECPQWKIERLAP